MKLIPGISIMMLVLIAICLPGVQTTATPNWDKNDATGNWSCWDDGTIDPCHNSLNSVTMVSITDGWAVGENGMILYWDGYDWVKFVSPTTNGLNDVQLYSSNDGWAIGNAGNILHWDGINWSPMSSPTGYDLQSISIVSPTNAWIAGWKILHWDGSLWSQVSTPNNYSRAISMVPGANGADGWAVGYNGSILRWDGDQWNVFTSPTTAYMNDVEMISATDGWATGFNGTVLHWDGISWSIVEFPGSSISTIWGIDAASSNDVWAIGFDNGGNIIYHWDGTNWFMNYGNANFITYSGIAITPNTDGTDAWVVGGSGYILHWEDNEWTPINEPYTVGLYAIQMLSPTDGWAGGSGFPVTMGDAFHWNGVNWTSQERMEILGLDFYTDPSGTMGWAVGTWGDISKWDGMNWSSVSSPSSIDLTSVDIISPEDAWAVGAGVDPDHGYDYRGVIVHYENNEWITVTLPTTTTMVIDVSMLSPTSGWSVGPSGTILEWQGSGWQIASSPTTKNLSSIQMIDATNGWIVGANGTILHWDGLNWSIFSSPTASNLSDVKFNSTTDGWAVGSNGTIIRWDGINWTQVESPTRQIISAIAYSSPYELWAVGYNGIILHYEFNPILSINYTTGAPGSYFTLTGTQFPPDELIDITINGHSIGNIPSDSLGNFNFILLTSQANEGVYNVTANVNPRAFTKFILDNESPIRPQEGDYTIFDIPADIAYSHIVNLPLVRK